MELSLGFSPCPNDTYLFDALVNKKLPDNSYTFKTTIADVEELNLKCLAAELDICKISYHCYTKVYEDYQLLTAGSALGRGVGPLLISKQAYSIADVPNLKIVIPGEHTTANFLLKSAFSNIKQVESRLFSDIEKAVINGEFDAGVIIHENRFTYHERGLLKILDLGTNWEKETGLPIPLGGIAIKRTLPEALKLEINQLLIQSVQFAFDYPDLALPFVKAHAQEMDPNIILKHIDTYVNNYTLDIGIEGKSAVKEMFLRIDKDNNSTIIPQNIFVK